MSVQTVHANNSRQLSKCGERASKSSVYFKPYQEYPSVAMLCPSGPFLNAHIKNWWHCFFGIRAACPPPQVKAGASSHHAIPPQVITIPMCIEHACTNQTILMHAGGAPAGGACMQVVPLQVVHACRWCPCRWCMHAGGAPAGGAPAGGACMQVVHACRWCPCRWCMHAGGACMQVMHACRWCPCRWCMHAGGACMQVVPLQVVPLQVVHACRRCMHAGGAPGQRTGGTSPIVDGKRSLTQQEPSFGWFALAAGLCSPWPLPAANDTRSTHCSKDEVFFCVHMKQINLFGPACTQRCAQYNKRHFCSSTLPSSLYLTAK